MTLKAKSTRTIRTTVHSRLEITGPQLTELLRSTGLPLPSDRLIEVSVSAGYGDEATGPIDTVHLTLAWSEVAVVKEAL